MKRYILLAGSYDDLGWDGAFQGDFDRSEAAMDAGTKFHGDRPSSGAWAEVVDTQTRSVIMWGSVPYGVAPRPLEWRVTRL